MKTFDFLILIALIAFVLGYNRKRECTNTKDGRKRCCWWNSNTCCEGRRPGQACGMAFTRCCKIYNIPKKVENSDIMYTKTKKE